jgi:uncharacterized protein (DUF2164 family)
MTLKEDLRDWIETNITEITDSSYEELWMFLQDKIGPVQEKLMNDIQMLRDEKRQLERKLEATVNDLSRLRQRDNSKDA